MSAPETPGPVIVEDIQPVEVAPVVETPPAEPKVEESATATVVSGLIV